MDYSQQIYEWLTEGLGLAIEDLYALQLVYGGLQVGALLVIVFLFAFNTVRRKR